MWQGRCSRATSQMAVGMWGGGRSRHDGPGGQKEGPEGNFQKLTLSSLFLPATSHPPKGSTAFAKWSSVGEEALET